MKLQYSFISFFLLLFSGSVIAQDIYLCIWRNPERTMSRIFPDAKDYKTVNVSIGDQKRSAIEKRTGHPLLPGQRDQFQYFEMSGSDGKLLGFIIAASQKGQYGAIEFVFGMDKSYKVLSMYIQRSRERDTEFKKKEFLDSFTGYTLNDVSKINIPKGVAHTKGTEATVRGLIKELICFDELVVKGGK